jgi:hypothetical protein
MARILLYVILAALILGGAYAYMDQGSVEIKSDLLGAKGRKFYQHDGTWQYTGTGAAGKYPQGPVLYEGTLKPQDCFHQAGTYPYSGKGSVGGINAYGTTCGIYATDQMHHMRFGHGAHSGYSPSLFTGIGSYF